MNQLKINLVIISFIFLIGCADDPDGKCEPIKINQSRVCFLAEGGSAVVEMYNYPNWWIQELQEKSGDIPSCNISMNDSLKMIENKWYDIVVPTESRNYLFITVFPNTTGKIRELLLRMNAGDTGTTIKITQYG